MGVVEYLRKECVHRELCAMSECGRWVLKECYAGVGVSVKATLECAMDLRGEYPNNLRKRVLCMRCGEYLKPPCRTVLCGLRGVYKTIL